MSDYRRFIAYLYEYPQNRKGNCCGFVRVESQNNCCRMDFQLKVLSSCPDQTLSVYGLIRRDHALYGILLGTFPLRRPPAGIQLFTHADRIGDTSFSLSDLSGLVLLSGESCFIGTQWDDLPILPEQFSPALPPDDAQDSPDASSITLHMTSVEPSVHPVPEDSSVSESRIPPASSDSLPPSDTSVSSASRPDAGRSSWYLQLSEQFPAFHPFSDDEMTDCLQLSPESFSELALLGCPVENSPFLLRNFQMYHHLLLARNLEQPDLLYLGVPGIYTPNEQFMASLFGFFRFKQAIRPDACPAPADARYGYWYRSFS